MNNKMKIAVMAGTPVDTQMGADCLLKKGFDNLLYLPVSNNPQEQTEFQISSEDNKKNKMLELLNKAKENGYDRLFVYCNSLSASVDFDELASETGLRIVTPLHVYKDLALKYKKLGVIAANAQGLSGIEKVLVNTNRELEFLGTGLLPLVKSIESGEEPDKLVEKHNLADLADWFDKSDMEAVLLGCTHFPYVKEALAKRISIPLIDPADEMIKKITE